MLKETLPKTVAEDAHTPIANTPDWNDASRFDSADARLMGEMNRSIVLNLIRQEGSISRTTIAHRTKLSRSAVSNIITSLIDEGLVHHSGTGESSGGRRPIILNFNYSAAYLVGLDISTNELFGIITDLEGNIVAQKATSYSIALGPERSLPLIKDHLHQLLKLVPNANRRVLGVGVGVPGPLDQTTGTVIAPPIMPGWSRFPLLRHLSAQFELPVMVENDANLGAIAEKWRGAGIGHQHLAYLKVAEGIGCGLILDGNIYRGQRGSAGEIGHITITRDGPPCKCGSYGCLESMAAAPALLNRARMAILAGRTTSLRHIDDLTIEHISAAAFKGDELACELFEDAGRFIGIALASLINLLNPGIIILDGSIASGGKLITRPINETIRNRSLLANNEQTKIVVGQLGREAVALGAVNLVLQKVFRGPELALAAS